MFVSLRRSPYAVTGSKLPTAVGTTPAPQNIISLILVSFSLQILPVEPVKLIQVKTA
jgi:hypothetical protein